MDSCTLSSRHTGQQAERMWVHGVPAWCLHFCMGWVWIPETIASVCMYVPTFGWLLGQLWDDKFILCRLPRVWIICLSTSDGRSAGKRLRGAGCIKGTTGAFLEYLLAEELHELRRQTTGVRCLVSTTSVAAVAGGKRQGHVTGVLQTATDTHWQCLHLTPSIIVFLQTVQR